MADVPRWRLGGDGLEVCKCTIDNDQLSLHINAQMAQAPLRRQVI
jgi:hypothetical protein